MKKIQFIITFTILNTLVLFANDDEAMVTIHAVDTNLPDLLATLANESGYNIVTGPNVNENELLTIHLDNVSVDQAINLIVRASGLSYEIVGNSILVANKERLSEDVGIMPYVFSLNYANAEEVSRLLFNITDQITIDQTGNNLLVSASPKKIAEIEEIITEVDVPATQIMLEAKLIEVGLTDDDKLGIDWAKLSQLSLIFAETGDPIDLGGENFTGSLIPGLTSSLQTTDTGFEVIENLNPTTAGQLPDEMYFQRLSSDNKFGLSRQLTAFDLTLDFLLKNNKADILANSQVVTLNGHEATISMVDVVPYILSSGGLGGQVQVQREEIGIKLNILPTVNKDGFITTKVTPEVSSIYDFIGPDRNIPWVKKRTSTTTIRVKNDESIVIAGLLSADKKKVQSKFPLLWRIPWLGPKFFTHNSEIENKTDLIIQITPKIVKDNYTGIEISNAIKGVESDLMNELENDILEQLVREVKKNSDTDEIVKLQKALGMKDEDIDGKWGPKTDEYINRYLNKDKEE
ncbi:MAG: hypothetical protein CMG00_03175 [Candidatus Marinimicrobia bacterium]|nr:hypothetical protein [Candidatus Neomarinimicrobiota bacterium]|tara:strand:- start:210 stop:1766 length:1557 start_codon:yes stop_codon:yes gene_type:complete